MGKVLRTPISRSRRRTTVRPPKRGRSSQYSINIRGASANLTEPKQAWIGEFVWAPDSRSLLYVPNEQTNASGDQMFEQAITRIRLESDKIEPLTSGPLVNYSVSFSSDGSRIAYKSVERQTMGDVY